MSIDSCVPLMLLPSPLPSCSAPTVLNALKTFVPGKAAARTSPPGRRYMEVVRGWIELIAMNERGKGNVLPHDIT